jgi:LPS-assembly protein
MSATVLLALLVLGQTSPPPPRTVESSADRLVFTPSSRALQLLGNARLFAPGLLLRADEIDYDPETDRAQARDRVVFSSGLLGGTALALDVDVGKQAGVFEGATLYQKSHTTPEALAKVRTPTQMRLLGRNEITLRADVVRRLAPETFEAEGVYVTPCDCREAHWITEPPSWSIRARSARIAAGQSARLSWARLYIKDVPTLPVPLLLLPLSNRQTGFLLPRPNYTARNGVQLEAPFFWAISRSVDATLTPGYFFGERRIDDSGMRGPRLDTELRYVPSLSTHGKLTVAVVEDLKQRGSGDGRQRGGPRGELAWTHAQELGHGFEDRIDAAAVSDQAYFRDVTTDLVVQQLDYLRSDARLEHRTDATVLTLGGSYAQALRNTPTDPAQAPLAPFFGPHNVNATTFQRLPALSSFLLEQALGPLQGALELDAVRYAPLSAQPRSPQTLPGLREVTDRVGATPHLSLPILLGRYAELVPYVIARGDLWHVDAPSDPTRVRAMAITGATLQSELSRVFTDSAGVRYRHVLEPALEVRSIPFVSGLRPDVPNDELDAPSGNVRPVSPDGASSSAYLDALSSDLAAPAHPLQATAVLRTRLDRKQGDAVSEPLRAELGQGYDLARSAPADTFARLAVQLGPVSGGGELRYALTQRRVVGVSGRLAYQSPGGSSVNVRYQRLRRSLTDPMRAGLFDLVGAPPDTNAAGASIAFLAEQLDLGGRYRPSPWFSVDGGVSYLPNALGTRVGGLPASPIFQRLLSYSAGLSYGSPCDCWGVRLSAVFNPTPDSRPWVPTSFMVVLDAHRLGGNFGG